MRHFILNFRFLFVVLACSQIIEIKAAGVSKAPRKRVASDNAAQMTHTNHSTGVSQTAASAVANKLDSLKDSDVHADGSQAKPALTKDIDGEGQEEEDTLPGAHDTHNHTEKGKPKSGPKNLAPVDEVSVLPEKESLHEDGVDQLAHTDLKNVASEEKKEPIEAPAENSDSSHEGGVDQHKIHSDHENAAPAEESKADEPTSNLKPAHEDGVDQTIIAKGDSEDPSKLPLYPVAGKDESADQLQVTTDGKNVKGPGGSANGKNGHKNVVNKNAKDEAVKVQADEMNESDDLLIGEVLQHEFADVTPMSELDAAKNLQAEEELGADPKVETTNITTTVHPGNSSATLYPFTEEGTSFGSIVREAGVSGAKRTAIIAMTAYILTPLSIFFFFDKY